MKIDVRCPCLGGRALDSLMQGVPEMPSTRSIAAVAAFSLLLIPTTGSALTSTEARCRDTIAKSMASYSKSVQQAVSSCHRQRSTGGRPLSVNCNDPSQADTSGRLSAARSSIHSAVASACAGASSLLSQYPSCPAPAATADDGGASHNIDDFGEVADCLTALTDATVGLFSADALGDPDATLSQDALGCQNTMSKLAATLVKAYMREGRKCQRHLDATSDDPSYQCADSDPRGRLAKAQQKFNDKFSPSCLLPSSKLAELNACSDSFDTYRECARNAIAHGGAALIGDAYSLGGSSATTTTSTLQPTTTTAGPTTTTTVVGPTTTTLPDNSCGSTFPQCNGDCPAGETCEGVGAQCACVAAGGGACAPATILRTINAKYATPPTATQLSVGWSGNAHDVDIPDKVRDTVDVTCDDNCENCAVSLAPNLDDPGSNCRCTSDSTKNCTVVNGPDPDHCGGGLDNSCTCYFGSPLAISSGGTPVCVVNQITQDYTGTMNLRTGEWNVRIHLASIVYLGLDSVHPCPTCDGDDVPNDGIRNGTCNGGLTSGACDANGIHRTFGPTSFDCPPPSSLNISGSGLLIDLKTSSQDQSLLAELPCDSPADQNCPCRVCSNNSSIGCSSDADCTEQGAGTCTAGGGAGVQPNGCDNFECGDNGRCVEGPIDTYCDGITHPDGRGFITCNSDVDCQPNNAGKCTIIDLRRCFTDPIQAVGKPDVANPVTSAIFCIPPTSSPAVNLTGGIPGPGTFTLDFDSDVRCQSDPSLPYEFPSGANCGAGPTTTSTTVLLPCESATNPVCGGTCPVGQTCGDDGAGGCQCTGVPTPACADSAAPVCGGTCSGTQVCTSNGSTCSCQDVVPACASATAPTCGGTCPGTNVCTSNGSTCSCQAPSPPACSAATAPTCGGTCSGTQVCMSNGSTCSCQDVVPTCASSTAPICGGTCAGTQVCMSNGSTCSCQDPPTPSCGSATAPVCAGTCAGTQICQANGSVCHCVSLP